MLHFRNDRTEIQRERLVTSQIGVPKTNIPKIRFSPPQTGSCSCELHLRLARPSTQGPKTRLLPLHLMGHPVPRFHLLMAQNLSLPSILTITLLFSCFFKFYGGLLTAALCLPHPALVHASHSCCRKVFATEPQSGVPALKILPWHSSFRIYLKLTPWYNIFLTILPSFTSRPSMHTHTRAPTAIETKYLISYLFLCEIFSVIFYSILLYSIFSFKMLDMTLSVRGS